KPRRRRSAALGMTENSPMRLLPEDERQSWTVWVWLVYLSVFVVVPALKPHTTPLEWVATFAGLLVFLVLYVRGFWVRGRDVYPIIAAITLLGLIFYPSNPGGGTFFIFAASFAARLGPG